MAKRDLITKDFALYVVHYFNSMLTWSKEDILGEIDRTIKEAKPEDAVPVVRCKDCKHFVADTKVGGKWISVKDGLPESGKDAVMIALRWGEVDIGWCEDEKWGSEFVNEYEDGEVTYWMPLPQPPKGE